MKLLKNHEISESDTNASVVQRLIDEFPRRESEIRTLNAATLSSQHIILYGPSGCGKTAILRKLLKLKNKKYIFLDCKQCYTSRIFHLHLLWELFGRIEDRFKAVDSLNDCMNIFKRATHQKDELRYIVLKNFEFLSAKIPALLAFQRTLLEKGWRFYFAFISEHWQHMLELLYATPCSPVVDFLSYTQDQLFDILFHLRKDKYDNQLLRNLLTVLLPIVTQIYVDIDDVTRVTDDLFPIYKKPVDEGKLCIDNVAALSRNLNEPLKKISTDLIYIYSHFDDVGEKTSADVELPMNTKFLLVAAYIASHVPPKDDQKFFLKQHLKKKRRHMTVSQPARNTQIDTSLGPKSFPFSRLMAIYFSIVDENPSMTANLISQVATLVDLKLLLPVSEGNLDTPTYKCIADSHLVYSVSRSVEFDLRKYVPM